MVKYHELIMAHPQLFTNNDALLKVIKDKAVIKEWEKKKLIELIERKQEKEWGKIGILVDDPYNIVIRDLVEFPDGERKGYIRSIGRANLFGGKAVVILPLYNGKICMINIFRHPTRQWHWEIPRGYGESGIPSQENAIKEVTEELGCEVNKITYLGEVYSNTGYECASVDVFAAIISNLGNTEQNEGITKLKLVTRHGFEKLIHEGKINDGFTLSAYAMAINKGVFG